MKLAGFLMLIAGGIIAMAAIAVLPATGARAAFLLAGIGVESIGLVLAFRAHIPPEAIKEERR
ncbi:MAG TPA: hypothetical protein VIY49_38375 [Bryobacteraceae bacterium]|jgi:hypothetical protein